jgi:hypothetical protein
MKDIYGLGAFGTVPFLSEDIIKQARLANIRTQAGKIAYILALGKNAKKPRIKEGVHEARGALKWISEIIKEEKEK